MRSCKTKVWRRWAPAPPLGARAVGLRPSPLGWGSQTLQSSPDKRNGWSGAKLNLENPLQQLRKFAQVVPSVPKKNGFVT